MGVIQQRAPTCHPHLEYHAKDMCVTCYRKAWRKDNPERAAELRDRWRGENPLGLKEQRLRYRLRKYNLTKTQYEKLLKLQNELCAICGAPEPGGKGGWHIDHCHISGMIRGLLCLSCNIILGKAKDDVAVLGSAIDYLTKTRVDPRTL